MIKFSDRQVAMNFVAPPVSRTVVKPRESMALRTKVARRVMSCSVVWTMSDIVCRKSCQPVRTKPEGIRREVPSRLAGAKEHRCGSLGVC